MSFKRVIVCDVCGRQKGAAWRWIQFRTDMGSIRFQAWDDSAWPFRHACGRACANQALQRHLASRGTQP